MTIVSLEGFLNLLKETQLLAPEQLAEVLGPLLPRCPDSQGLASLARELMQRNWLTPYQVNKLLQGRPQELVLGPSYMLLERLGEGGMGRIFRAWHRKLGRVVALKLIRQEKLANPDAVRRFFREIRAASQLNHPNIVHAYDADEVDGTYFLVMEYVEGIDLAKLIATSGPLPILAACDYLRQAALGLQHAHEKGLIHRDIKPANLLLQRGQGSGVRGQEKAREISALTPDPSPLTPDTVKILDMGLARLDPGGEVESGVITRKGVVMGTPDYMSPEQSLESHTVDIRTDLYSLGCTLYFLLSGRVPFPGGSLGEKLLKHQLYQPDPLETLRPEVPREVLNIVTKLMAKDPAQRYQTPAELAQALEQLIKKWPLPPAAASPPPHHLAATPVPATPGPGERSDSFSRLRKQWANIVGAPILPTPDGPSPRNVLVALVTAVIVVLSLTIGIVAFFVGGKPEKTEEEVVPPRKTTPTVTEDWLRTIEGLPADRQAEAVLAKLKELNPDFDGQAEFKVVQEANVELSVCTDHVADIRPLQALTRLEKLTCAGSAPGQGKLSSLEPLWGLRLKVLEYPHNPWIDSTAPLAAMPLERLVCTGTGLQDLSRFRSMPLRDLRCGANPIADLTPLQGLALRALDISGTRVTDLTPLQDAPLEELRCHQVGNFLDLSPLQKAPLTHLTCAFSPWRHPDLLRSLRSLEKINDLPVAQFWKEVAQKQAAFDAWCQQVATLQPAAQLQAVVGELRQRNPQFDGQVSHFLDSKGQVNRLHFATEHVQDIAPLRALAGLRILVCEGTSDGNGSLADLGPLRGLKLEWLDCGFNPVKDLAPLQGMPLTFLSLRYTHVEDLALLKGLPLQSFNGTGTKITSLAPLAGMKLEQLYLNYANVTDLTPLRGLPLKYLTLDQNPVADLSPLQGMKLTALAIFKTKVTDLSSLRAMPLKTLAFDVVPWRDSELLRAVKTLETVNGQPARVSHAWADWLDAVRTMPAAKQVEAVLAKLEKRNPFFQGKITPVIENQSVKELTIKGDNKLVDLSPVRALPKLKHLICHAKGIDLSPLRGLALEGLWVYGPLVGDLSPLAGMPLQRLSVHGQVRDLSPLAGLPLKMLLLQHNPDLQDLSPLAGLPLEMLGLQGTAVTDLGVVKNMPLRWLDFPGFNRWRDAKLLRALPTLKWINGQAPPTLWKEVDAQRSAFEAWAKSLAPLPAAQQVEMVVAKLKELNPEFDGQVDPGISNGVVVRLWFTTQAVTDISPVRALPGLRQLLCPGASKTEGKLADLWPLAGLPLTEVNCHFTRVHDLAPLAGMPLESLNCGYTRVEDLSPLKGLPLTKLQCSMSPVTDLSPLQGLPLQQLLCQETRIRDLSPLADMPLHYLSCQSTEIQDFSPLLKTPVQELRCDYRRERDRNILRALKTLKTINGKPAAEVLK